MADNIELDEGASGKYSETREVSAGVHRQVEAIGQIDALALLHDYTVSELKTCTDANTDYAASGHGAAGDKWLVAYCASPFVLAMGTATSSTVGVGLAAGTWPFRITHTGVDADDTPHVQSSVAAAVVRLTWMRDLVL